MLSAEQQETLTRVGRGTPMGELLRRYWHPVAATCEINPRSAKKVRLLGEDLVLFRETGGQLGLVSERCPHRGASLNYGCVEDEGIRCPYHGWKFGVHGDCLDLPAVPPNIRLKNRIRVTAYPVQELGGLLFAYLGPEPVPLLPRYDLLVWDNALRDIGQALIPCNWLQIMENSLDPHHTEWLHGHHLAFMRGKTGQDAPNYYMRRHEKFGFDEFPHGIIKRRVLEGGSEKDDDWNIGHPVVFPTTLRVGENPRHRFQFRVPVDDTHTWHLWYSCYTFPSATQVPAQNQIPLYDVPWHDEHGEFIVDFIDGQDIMVWVTQGKIADRTQEHLTSSDKGITQFRRLLLQQIKTMQSGEDPMGVIRDEKQNAVIELPQEKNKYSGGQTFFKQAMEMGHGRHSPLRDQVLGLLEQSNF